MMNNRTMIALGIIGAAAFGWYWFKVRGQQTSNQAATGNAAQDQSLAMQEQQYYNQNPPQFGYLNQGGSVYTTQNGVTTVQSRQTMPLPYNT